MANNTMPSRSKALVCHSRSEPLQVTDVDTPKPGPGSLTVQVIFANVLPYAREVYTGERPYPFPTPMIPGSGCVGRVSALGPDTTAFEVGDLVLIHVFFHPRDDASAGFLFGLHSGMAKGTKHLMEGEWRNATYAEYVKVPLENCTKLPQQEDQLENFAYLGRLLVPYGGLLDINLQPGETIIVAPATGSFGGAAVEVALAMGARVIAAGRNAQALQTLTENMKSDRLRTVKTSGNAEADAEAIGRAEAFIDFSPPAAAKSTHILSCLMALKPGGRVSLMGGIQGNIELPYLLIMFNSLQLRGKFMYDREAPAKLVSLVEAGLIKLGGKRLKRFKLDEWKEAFEDAAANSGWGSQTLITP